ncbi:MULTISPECIES: STAS domain-containing protein [Streptomyces]|uniref:STAS domain-containing protein n=1 Tax=Streptomyces TaxID=1883 RepID=UPI00226F251B|nr:MULTISPECIES: STAS domain-containing protein [unclassified Streptomyces]MCY0943087.1 STAS domain-containing protein [Streptomyces sp. H34-AA3]MCY0949734.1 STAS domain-containing protein [Streptomyces sp. H27-S2]MCZ4084448.1 STAS domain-containing protein [Streptomyces sp. H34-S5]
MPTSADLPALPVVAPHGDLDADTIGTLTAEIESAAAAHRAVILDASGITFSDSSFLRLMLTTNQRVDLRIAAPSPVVARLFQLVCVEDVLRLFPTVQAARAGAPRS